MNKEIGYYIVKQYNHNPVIWYWNGESFESFRSQPQLDEVESFKPLTLQSLKDKLK